MRFAVLIAIVLLAGCSHVQLGMTSSSGAGSAPARGGTTVSGGSTGLQVSAGGSAAAVILAAALVAAAAQPAQEPGTFRSFAEFSDWFWGRRAPEMKPDRPVNEQDCTKPIGAGGNLRCR